MLHLFLELNQSCFASFNCFGRLGKRRVVFLSKFYSVLGQNGFTVDDVQPTYQISGQIVERESGFVIENYVYYAEGSLTISLVNDGSIAGVVPVSVKALGNTKSISAFNAFSLAGNKAGNDLTKILLNFEKE